MRVRAFPCTVMILMIATVGCAPIEPLVTLPDGSEVYGRSFSPTAEDGKVSLECDVAPDRTLINCVVLDEMPAGEGLGEVALATLAASPPRVTAEAAARGEKIKFDLRLRLGRE